MQTLLKMSKYFSLEDDDFIRSNHAGRGEINSFLRSSTPLTTDKIKRERSLSPWKPSKRSSVRKQYFSPSSDNVVPGHIQCPECSSYFPDDEVSRTNHLSQHKDRFITLTLPSTTCFTSIDQALVHLLRFGIQKQELRQKIVQCNLIIWPQLRGYSCGKCNKLDTNSYKEFSRHMKEVCGVRDKTKRAEYFIGFCRKCHRKFETRSDLEDHIEHESGDCWPSKEMIQDCVNKSQKNVQSRQQEMIKIKQEKVDTVVSNVEIKQELVDQTHSVRFTVPPSPVFSDPGDAPGAGPVPPVSPIISPSPIKTLTNNIPPPPSLSPSTTSSSTPTKDEMLSWSPPPSVDLSLTESLNRSSSLVSSRVSRDLMADMNRSKNVKIVNPEDCRRQLCDWSDRHVDNPGNTCIKSQIMKKCSTRSCVTADQHRTLPPCDKLSFHCNTTRDTKLFPVSISGGKIQESKEPRRVTMRLLYTKTSAVLTDPRVTRDNYPYPAETVAATCIRRQNWSVYTWSGLDKVKLKQISNPHLIEEVEDEIILL